MVELLRQLRDKGQDVAASEFSATPPAARDLYLDGFATRLRRSNVWCYTISEAGLDAIENHDNAGLTLAQRVDASRSQLTLSQNAKLLAADLIESAAGLDGIAKVNRGVGNANKAELLDLQAYQSRRAADLLLALEVEQERQRKAIENFLSGLIDQDALLEVSQTWSGNLTDDPKPLQGAPL